MIRSSFTRRQSLGLLGATLTPALGPAEAYAQLLPPIPSPSHPLPVDAATALIGRYIFTSGNKGQFVLGNVGSFVVEGLVDGVAGGQVQPVTSQARVHLVTRR